MPEWKCSTCGARWEGVREITGLPHVCGGKDMVPDIVNVTPSHKHTRECLFGCPELTAEEKWEREQEQLATEALAELRYPPYPRE